MSVLFKAFRYTAFGVLTLVLAGLLALSYLVHDVRTRRLPGRPD